ncbi:MAG: exodeoxyribonuclease VII large subunit [Candidatus Omnitrophota bacterium]|jgi:exodeoxyribonuclease VII large subunit|nr:MAG: exodeoxyribonuclease VII large subunit [Candidatus Omnitrophota bacterium]
MPNNSTDGSSIFPVAQQQGLGGKAVLTVSQVTQDIKLVLESNFQGLWIEGEITNFRPSSSGHYYFSLKDDLALLNSVIFSRIAKTVKFNPENGLKVICFGNIEVYGPHGKYQLIIEKIEPKGIGSLQLALEQLKNKLEKEGLFSEQRKRPIPYLPSVIGIVTSLSGAAIRDMLKVLDNRFRDAHIIIKPTMVQGSTAKDEIAKAIEELNFFNESAPKEDRIEVMIVGRGGGSMEDLWAFNEEVVARAIYKSRIPVISAVGHERDITIADLVADMRASTPSVAAEKVIPRKEDLKQRLGELKGDLLRSFMEIHDNYQAFVLENVRRIILSANHIIELNFSRFNTGLRKLHLLNPVAVIQQYKDRITDLARQIFVRTSHYVRLREAEYVRAAGRLSDLSPLAILSRGYSITFNISSGEVIKNTKILKKGDLIKTRLSEGEIISSVTEVKKDG